MSVPHQPTLLDDPTAGPAPSAPALDVSALPADPDGVLQAAFGFDGFRRGQREIIDAVLRGRDTLAVMPTGGGKSVCYQVPALIRPGVTVVVSPLISLMIDQVQALHARGIPAGCIHAEQSVADKRAVFAAMRRAERFLLYLSPERVQKEGFQRWFAAQNLALVAIDEAHCVSQWGHDFRPDYVRLRSLRALRPEVPVLALTATATPAVLEDIAAQLDLHEPERHVYGFYRPNLYYQVEFVDSDEEKLAWIRQALRQRTRGRAIVYCGTRRQSEDVAALLGGPDDGVGVYHAGLAGEAREAVQRAFDAGELPVLCATNAFGMGIDQPDVRLVVHAQMPGNLESLYQEMGRAGRDGDPAACLLLYARRDRGLQNYFIRNSEADYQIKRRRYKALDHLVQYAEGGDCRHGGILTYFRDAQRLEACGHCDACAPEDARRIDLPHATRATLPAKKSRRKRTASPAVDQHRPLDGVELARQQAIKAWRKAYAREREMAAFLVFSNKTLRALAVMAPQTTEQLLDVPGIGEQKAEAFGAELLDVIAAAGEG